MPVQHTKDICKQKLAGDTLMMNFKVHSAEKLSPAKLCPQGFFSHLTLATFQWEF